MLITFKLPMKKVPKIVNKIPLYIILVLIIAVTAIFLTGKLKLQVVNVSAGPETSSTSYEIYSGPEFASLKDIIKDDKTIVLIKSSWCSNCSYMEVELKQFISTHTEFKVIEIDLDTYRNDLLNDTIDQAPTIVRTISSELFIQQGISISDFNDLVDRELLGV